MTKEALESYDRIVSNRYDLAEIIAAIGKELRIIERYRAKELRESLAGVRLAIMNVVASEDVNAKIRNIILNAPLKSK